jgi:hypothetical protein
LKRIPDVAGELEDLGFAGDAASVSTGTIFGAGSGAGVDTGVDTGVGAGAGAGIGTGGGEARTGAGSTAAGTGVGAGGGVARTGDGSTAAGSGSAGARGVAAGLTRRREGDGGWAEAAWRSRSAFFRASLMRLMEVSWRTGTQRIGYWRQDYLMKSGN